MANLIYKLMRSATYINGESLVGQVKNIELPDITWDMTDHEAIGLVGVGEYARRIPALEATITTTGESPKLSAVAMNPHNAATIQVRMAYGEFAGAQRVRSVPKIITIVGRFKSYTMGEITQDSEPENEQMLTVDALRITWDGSAILNYAREANIYTTSDVDFAAELAQILGE